jgi:hypothetical protein
MQKIKIAVWTGLGKLLPALGGSLNKNFPTLQKSLNFFKERLTQPFCIISAAVSSVLHVLSRNVQQSRSYAPAVAAHIWIIKSVQTERKILRHNKRAPSA